MGTATTTKTTKVGLPTTAGGGDGEAQAARVWLTRRLGWERRLAELRVDAAAR